MQTNLKDNFLFGLILAIFFTVTIYSDYKKTQIRITMIKEEKFKVNLGGVLDLSLIHI